MACYAVYDHVSSVPVFTSKSRVQAQAFVGNAIALFQLCRFDHLTITQAKVLPYAWAKDFESRIKECINVYTN